MDEAPSLEEIATSLRRSTKPLKFVPLGDFETKIERVAKRYGGTIGAKRGSYRALTLAGKTMGWPLKSKGNEGVMSLNLFRRIIEDVSNATGIPYPLLELYFSGSSKLYKEYKQRFEERYL